MCKVEVLGFSKKGTVGSVNAINHCIFFYHFLNLKEMDVEKEGQIRASSYTMERQVLFAEAAK